MLTAFPKTSLSSPVAVEVERSDREYTVVFDQQRLTFKLHGPTTPPPSNDDFAIWCILPLAMRAGRNVEFKGPVSKTALANAQQLVDIWAMWVPEKYSPVTLSAKTYAANGQGTDGAALLYSGGVDATFALVSEKRAHDIRLAVTVHGLDYDAVKQKPFDGLRARTRPLLAKYRVEQVIVETNAGKIIGDLGLTHAFVLASCLFLAATAQSKGLLAADLTPAQEMMVFPWGTNHVTNRLFASDDFTMHTVSSDFDRIRKLEILLEDDTALAALSCCGDKKRRPDNCGVCPKCMRTKSMFLAVSGEVPPIFLDNTVTSAQIQQLDVSSNAAYKHYSQIVRTARQRGHLDALPGLEDHVEKSVRAQRQGYVRNSIVRRISRSIGLI